MKSIQVSKYKSSELNPEFKTIHSLEIEDTPFDRGAFGELYFCNTINGLQISTPQVVKVLIDDGTGSAKRGFITINKLQDQIIKHNAYLKLQKQKPIEHTNALFALPQFSYEALLDGKKVVGYSANRLNTSNYFLFEKIFNDPDENKRKVLRTTFYNLPVEQRLKFAFDLVEGFRILQEMSYIYADLNPKNFFVNINENRLCLIDYDSGAVTNNSTDKADTFGKLGEWLAPEIQEQLLQNISGDIKVDLNTDTWAVAIAIHFMFFNFHPLFYLKVRGKKEMQNYFKAYKWPAIEKSNSNFRTELSARYDWYIEQLNTKIPQSIVNAFTETINNSYGNPNRRVSYKQWMIITKGIMRPPVISSFESDREYILAGNSITLTWKVDNAHTLTIDNGLGDVTKKSDVKLNPHQGITYTLKAIGHFGETEKSASIKMFPTPVIESLLIPTPSFKSTYNIDSINISSPSLSNKVDVDTRLFVQTPDSISLHQSIADVKPILVKEKVSITAIFEKIKESINNSIK